MATEERLQNHNPKAKLTYLVFLTLSLLSLLFLSINNFISHSEFWSIASAKMLGSSLDQATPLYYKVIFYIPLKLLFWLNLDNTTHILAARSLFGLIAFTNFTLILQNIYWITKSYLQPIIFGLFLISFQIYFYNIFRVRADVIGTFFVLLSYTLINFSYLNNKKTKNLKIITFTLYALAFLATPKSIYLVFALLLYQSSLMRPKGLKLKKVLFFIAPVTIFTFSLIITTSLLAEYIGWSEHPYGLAFRYHFNSLQNLFNNLNWLPLMSSLKINFFHYFLIASGLGFFISSKENKKSLLLKSQILLFFLTLLIVLIHPEKWNYFIAQMIPFLSLPLIFILSYLKKNRAKIGLSFCVIISPFLLTNYHSWFHSNKRQLKVIKNLALLMAPFPNSIYFDSTGLLPRKDGLMTFVGPNDDNSRRYTLNAVVQFKPEFIFFTSKLRLLNPEITPFLYENYVELHTDIWVREDLDYKNLTLPEDIAGLSLQNLFIFDYSPHIKTLFSN